MKISKNHSSQFSNGSVVSGEKIFSGIFLPFKTISAILDVRSEQNEEYLYLWHHLVQEALVHEKITECFGKLFFILGKHLSTSHSKQGLTYTSLLKGQVIRPPCPLNTLPFYN